MAPDPTPSQPAKPLPLDAEVRDTNAADTEEQAFEAEPQERSYDPSDLEATRARQQGLGVGARDLARQRDPGRPAPAADEGEDE